MIEASNIWRVQKYTDEKWVMHIVEKWTWQWTLWSGKPCSKDDIIYDTHDMGKKQIFSNTGHKEARQLPTDHDEGVLLNY